MRRVETVHTQFQSLEVWKSDVATEFRVAGAIHAWHHSRRFLTGLAWDLIAASVLLRKDGPPRSILMLGLAGGTAYRVLRHLLPDCQLTAIDIDGEIVSLARRHMDLDELGIEIHTADAYEWLAKNQRRFDVVFDDIYLAGKTDVFRPRAWNSELMDHLRRAVAPGGLLAVNLVVGPGHRTMQSLTRKILRGSFPTVRSLTTLQSMNEVLVAGDAVATGPRLESHGEMFHDWRDRMYWDRIKVRRIS
ncbi:methyltransferase domain-containing protein [Luteolibacter yonseiensis]|uniref:Methyltransferase domain-containing protein n=1 Tax=Luteolibacter yonseiensis TaxID=1144680 RepID=A0A934R7J3_9BACT|nr:methyltransferase domain-containing protein [Luteolibacter yonseiensis]MBK1816900.1 methyltransferase domain-containing protein [Luteolibacter yonseiensis]